MNPVSAGSVKVGRTKIGITIEGCVDCGDSTGSRAWYPARTVEIKIGNKEFEIVLHRCDDCEQKQMPLFRAIAQD